MWERLKSAVNLAYVRRGLPSVSASPDAPQHILLVVVDALRADAVTAEHTKDCRVSRISTFRNYN
jgi:membrane-anchored protein YejM (alkaline phosphatase superfamily)